jgi:hypothetical protein
MKGIGTIGSEYGGVLNRRNDVLWTAAVIMMRGLGGSAMSWLCRSSSDYQK